MLQVSYKQESEIPEGLKEHYEEKEGTWILSGFVPKAKLDEFRSNNRDLAKAKETLEAQLLKFKDIDPTKYAESVQKLQELENERLAAAGEWKILQANLEQSHADALKAEKGRVKAIQEGWNKEKIANQTAMVVMKHAIPEEGNMKYIQADILEMASIDLETNQIVFLDEKGLKKKNEAGDANLTLEEFLTKTYIPKSKLFLKSQGGGAIGTPNIPFIGAGQVSVDAISGRNIPGSMIEDLASGKIVAM
jgi:AAA15 family ATPase/GTPase